MDKEVYRIMDMVNLLSCLSYDAGKFRDQHSTLPNPRSPEIKALVRAIHNELTSVLGGTKAPVESHDSRQRIAPQRDRKIGGDAPQNDRDTAKTDWSR